jgi:hypothetical protein
MGLLTVSPEEVLARIAAWDTRISCKLRVDTATGCLVWMGARSKKGYGQITRDSKQYGAHCWIYYRLVGPVMKPLELDHVCRNPACANINHLEPVSRSENNLRGAHPNAAKVMCPRGHLYDAKNTHVTSKGTRHCRRCAADQAYARRHPNDRK